MQNEDLLIALATTRGIPYAAQCRLASCVEDWRHAEGKEAPSLCHLLGVPLPTLQLALRLRPDATALATRQKLQAEGHGCRILTCTDAEYPRQFHDLALPPPLLYCRGQLPIGPAIAMVGSRKMDSYGRQVAHTFALALARAGVAIVSGFARGVDAVCHRAALEAAGGSTVAVHGCGLDLDYPSGQRPLAEAIARRGASLTEFAFGREPRGWHFPVRNRLIAALAHGTLVVQAARRSGSLITAHHAMELGRDVFAVPGRIFDPLSQGCNSLIADGALVARTAEDILDGLCLAKVEKLGIELSTPSPCKPPPKGFAGTLLDHLPEGEALSAEDLANACGKAIDRVLAALLELELGGWLRREPGPVYVR